MVSMDHARIEEEGVAELYATGRLPPADEEEFEIHLLECRECRERVALADDLRASVRTIAAEEATRSAVQLGLFGWLARRSRAARLGLAILPLLLLAALPAWLLVERARLESELAVARAAAERAHPPAPPPPLVPPADSGQELERLAQERSRLEEDLRQERLARESLAGQVARLTRPQINAAVYSLGLVRSGDQANQIRLEASPAWIVLSLELPLEGENTGEDTYRATLLDARGTTVWEGDGLERTASDTLSLLLYSDLLQPGAYRLRLEGHAKGGSRTASVTEIPFRVER